jgi:hypothetical protein
MVDKIFFDYKTFDYKGKAFFDCTIFYIYIITFLNTKNTNNINIDRIFLC